MPGEQEQIALLMADIDHFKEINDTFGHEVGDHVLRALGHILATDARSGQVVVRYGGEEFVFALPSVELEAARDFAERIRLKVELLPLGGTGDAPRGNDQHRCGLRPARQLAVSPCGRRPRALPRQEAGEEPRGGLSPHREANRLSD